MNILVIGGGGFIGSHLSEEILNRHSDWYLISIDIDSQKVSHLLGNKNFNFVSLDILKESVEEHVKRCDVVLPLAAIANPATYVTDPLRVFELDFEANLRIVKLAVKHNKRLIFPSTSEVYGMCTDVDGFDEEASNCVTGPICKQRWIYSTSKQLLDRVIYAYGDRLNYTLFRPFNWIGPRLDNIESAGHSRVVTKFLSDILRGRNLVLVNGGQQQRCFTYISDGIDALIKILENENKCAERKIFNIGNPNNELSIRSLAEKILYMARNYRSLQKHLDGVSIVEMDSADYYGGSYQDVTRRIPSIRRAKECLGWEPIVGIDDLLQRTMDFYFKW